MDVRKARRAMRLRGEVDPDVVARSLESILREVIATRAADPNGSLGKAALNELENIRSDLIAQQIDAGKKSGLLVGKYSLVIDELKSVDQNAEGDSFAKEGMDSVKSALGSIADSIPSAQTITSALITANPFLGYGAKIITDLLSSSKDRKSALKQQRERQKRILQDQAKALEEQLDNLDQEKDVLEQQEDINESEMNDSGECEQDCTQDEIIVSLLEDVRSEMNKLYLVWADEDDIEKKDIAIEDGGSEVIEGDDIGTTSTDDLLQQMIDQQEESNQMLERIHDDGEELADLERSRNDLLEFSDREGELEGSAAGLVPDFGMNEKSDSGGLSALEALGLSRFAPMAGVGVGSFLGTAIGNMFGGIGTFLKGIATSLFSIVTAVFNPITKLAPILGRFVSKVARFGLIVEAIMTVISFGDGFINAANILNKEENELTISDRLTAASASVVAHFMNLADWVVERFGEDTDLPDDKLERQQFVSEKLMRMRNTISKNTEDWLDRFVEDITSSWQLVMDSISDWWDSVNPLNKLKEFFNKRNEFSEQDAVGFDVTSEIERSQNKSFFDRLFDFETGSATTDISNAYLNVNNYSRLTDPVVDERSVEMYEEKTTQLESMLESIERQDSQEIINNNQKSNINMTPINNVTNNSVNQTSVQPRMGSSMNKEPAFRRQQSTSQRYGF